jgi:hypothetical protein
VYATQGDKKGNTVSDGDGDAAIDDPDDSAEKLLEQNDQRYV